jgi:superfamily II DNA helicase RecQ
MSSLRESDSVLRVVFATMALGMGVDFKSLGYIIHYGAPRSLEDYIQESGRAGRDHQQSVSRIYWKPCEAPVYANQSVHRYKELKDVRDYLENTEHCRRFMLLKYFDPAVAMTLGSRDSTLCCDYCRSKLQ